jgi:chromosome segregation protein
VTKINKVVLVGFKSFQKKTTIPFFDGLTTIVGENGAGKSNLFDAISFVMGRRSSQLRADRLEQLIFNGGERHSPADEADVILHFDNQDGVFNRFLENGNRSPEIVLGRRITRSSSTYTFMGKACPRSLIDEILEEAKIDPDGQQLIAQGMITDVIKRNPVRRREILDEVSGIAAYDEKRREAIGELKEVKSKLNTHRVILAERRRRLVALGRERDAAQEHERLTAEQARLEESIRHTRREKAKERLRRAQGERTGMAEKTKSLEAEVATLDLAVENKEWEIEGIQEEAHGESPIALVKEVERLRAEILHKEGEANLKREQAKNLAEMIDEVARIKAVEAERAKTTAGANRTVQALLERKRAGVYGTIASLATPRPGFEVAFETAAGASLNDVVVDSRETAIACINYLKQNRLGRARFLPLGRLVAPKKSLAAADALRLPGLVDYAINLVEFDPKYQRAFEYVLSDTVVAENLDAVRDVDGVRVVTLDGDLQSRGGALTGGSRADSRSTSAPAKPHDTGFDTAKKRHEILKLEREIERIAEEIVERRTLLEEKERELRAQEEEGTRAKGTATARGDELHALREKRRQTYQELETLRRALGRYEREEAEAQAELAALGKDEHDPAYYIEGPIAELERRIEENKRHIRRLEPVNMRAIEEYATYEQEFNLFQERVNALENEKHEIELLIGDIEERKRERFLETLAAVRSQFDRIFKELFQGGSASLELEVPGDISSGLLIKANPPEKEPHLLDSLSGGEQTLVATAFIFALQEYQQAPFFILDEVDAALDVVNVTRLARMLREYAKRLQVIVVSHNEETVRHADRAYGVTMKNGASQVLALNLN